MGIENKDLFIAIIGTGPIGLECGLQAFQRGYRFILFESGEDIASNVRLWSHVRLFSPLSMNISSLGKSLLNLNDHTDDYLTGGEYLQRYLRPVSELFQSNIRLRHRVISIGRYHQQQFIILVQNQSNGCEEYFVADCVIDASGTYANPNYTGPGYLPAIGEKLIRSSMPSVITSFIPDLSREAMGKRRILLLGKGYSAATSAIALAKLKEEHPDVELFWLLKQNISHLPYCTNPDDPLKYRQELSEKVNDIYANGKVFTKIYTNTVIRQFTISPSGRTVDVILDLTPVEQLANIDLIIANTGAQPDRTLYANLSVHECYRSKGPMALAVKLLSSSSSDCLKQTSHGAQSMMTTEKNFFIVGNKSYGKQSNFLLQIGFQQVEEVYQLIKEYQEQSKDIASTENHCEISCC